VAYLTVLRTKTFERIERDNTTVTRTNLELARLRVSTGAASQAEIYRWQTQVANNQQAVVDAEIRRSIAEIEVNRILHRPLEERFETEEATLTDPAPLGGGGQLDQIRPYIDNPRDFELFRRFMTEEAIPVAPELRQIDALTRAQERQLQSASRSFYLPRAELQVDLDNRFAKSGVGSDPTAGIQLNDFSWSAALFFSYPLFSGTARVAARDQAAKELTRLQLERDAAVDRIEQRMRASLHRLRGSLINIELSRIAADAAGDNFRLTQDAYRRGVGDILDVLDAQNEALVANESAASAVYDFLIDLIEAQRAAGRFDYFSSPADRENFLGRLEAFFEGARAQN
jgi:outer membrane protein TolC